MNKYLIFSYDSDSDRWDSWNKLCTIEGATAKEALGEYMKILDEEFKDMELTEANLKYHFPYLYNLGEGLSFKDYTWFSTEDSYCIWNPDLDCYTAVNISELCDLVKGEQNG
jgi:hypothetical protein